MKMLIKSLPPPPPKKKEAFPTFPTFSPVMRVASLMILTVKAGDPSVNRPVIDGLFTSPLPDGQQKLIPGQHHLAATKPQPFPSDFKCHLHNYHKNLFSVCITQSSLNISSDIFNVSRMQEHPTVPVWTLSALGYQGARAVGWGGGSQVI